MKHLMRYKGYTSKERSDDILDKISKYGIDSVTKLEKDFLDSHSSGNEEISHIEISIKETESSFEYDGGLFKFEYDHTEHIGDETHYIGKLYVPDLDLPNGVKIDGILEGKIIAFNSGQSSPDFHKEIIVKKINTSYDLFEFCDGLEYELDNFFDYIIDELKEKKSHL